MSRSTSPRRGTDSFPEHAGDPVVKIESSLTRVDDNPSDGGEVTAHATLLAPPAESGTTMEKAWRYVKNLVPAEQLKIVCTLLTCVVDTVKADADLHQKALANVTTMMHEKNAAKEERDLANAQKAEAEQERADLATANELQADTIVQQGDAIKKQAREIAQLHKYIEGDRVPHPDTVRAELLSHAVSRMERRLAEAEELAIEFEKKVLAAKETRKRILEELGGYELVKFARRR